MIPKLNEKELLQIQRNFIAATEEEIKLQGDQIVSNLKKMLDDYLLNAVFDNDLDNIKLLINNGADVNARHGHESTVLILSTRNERLDIMKLLVKHGADVNAQDKYGMTALHYANPKNKILQDFLIKSGADINIKNICSIRALEHRVEYDEN